MFTNICTITFPDGATIQAVLEASSPEGDSPVRWSGDVTRLGFDARRDQVSGLTFEHWIRFVTRDTAASVDFHRSGTYDTYAL